MIELVIDQRRKDLGGFEVGRVLPWAKRRMVGPFVFFDHMGPADFAPGLPRSVDVRPHPHIELSTITYLFEGEIGTEQPIRAGEVNWMTAGRGITHSERFEKARLQGDRLHGIQTCVALPDGEEETAPAFSHHAMDEQPLFQEGGVTGRLVAGRAFGVEAAARVHSPCSTPTGRLRRARSRAFRTSIPNVRPMSPSARSRSKDGGSERARWWCSRGAARWQYAHSKPRPSC